MATKATANEPLSDGTSQIAAADDGDFHKSIACDW